jgi:hypothetical protein
MSDSQVVSRALQVVSTRSNASGKQSKEDVIGAKFQDTRKKFKSLQGFGVNLNGLPWILSWDPSPIGLQC